MTRTKLRHVAMLTVLLMASAVVSASRQEGRRTPPPVPGAVMLVVKLVNPEQQAAKRAATVQVDVTGVELVDPATAGDKPMAGQAHLHYQVDAGLVIATPVPKLSFHELKPGDHVITVTLVANDHMALGSAQQVRVSVPGTTAAR